MPAQRELAAHVGIGVPAVSTFCREHGIDWKTITLDEWRLFYIARLRDAAAGRATSEGFGLADERARLAHHRANLIAHDEEVRRGSLLPLEDVRRKWEELFASARARLLSLPPRLASACANREAVEVETTARDIVNEALTELSRDTGSNGPTRSSED